MGPDYTGEIGEEKRFFGVASEQGLTPEPVASPFRHG